MICLAAACNSSIYLRDGVTDGDTFYLAERALTEPDPAFQSWVSYSLARSTCQLHVDTDNPARANSYACELQGRQLLLQTWAEKKVENAALSDAYLDELSLAQASGYLPAYVAYYFGKPDWQLPGDADVPGFRKWRRSVMPGHKPKTILTGSWNYRSR
jgi:hypothetical protein